MFKAISFVILTHLATVMPILYKIPDNFKIGLASSAYQIEGGWNLNGKGENIWDNLTHGHPDYTPDYSDGDIACDSYHKWKEDVQILKTLGVNYYRFSVSWSRILPTGFTNYINPDGIQYYNNLINELIKNNIEPIITIFHYDLPQTLQDLGGLASTQTSEYYEDFAKILFEKFGDRVKNWLTFNNPINFCRMGYNGGLAPVVHSPGIGCYLCGKTVLLAHARVYKLYQKYFKQIQKGKIGITVNTIWYEAKTNSKQDLEAQNQALEMSIGWWLNPILSPSGNYPEKMIKRIDYVSKLQNFSRSRLPKFTTDEIAMIKGSYDFIGVNYYTTRAVQPDLTPPFNPPSYEQDLGVKMEKSSKSIESVSNWLYIYPEGLRNVLNYIRTKYKNPPIIVTENGFPDYGDTEDNDRISYIKGHIIEIIKAIKDGCKIYGYIYWGLLDNFEWFDGYEIKYGVVQVDFDDPNRTRYLKLSGDFLRDTIKSKILTIN